MNKSLFCILGMHKWVRCKPRDTCIPKAGPFDPRSDEERTYTAQCWICAQCGHEEESINCPY